MPARTSSVVKKSPWAVLILTGLALAWLLATGCVAGAPTPTPTPTATATATPERPTPTPQPALQPVIQEQPTPAPTATRPPTPTPSPLPPPTATATPPTPAPATTADRNRLADAAFGYLRDLAEGLGARDSATEQELEAAEYLLARFTELGYRPALQEFERPAPAARLSLTLPDGAAAEEIPTFPLNGSAFGEVSGPLVFVGLGRAEDLPSGGLDGKVALLERGEITFRSKVNQVAGAGAVAAIVFNNRPGGFRGTLGATSDIPAVAIDRADGNRLRELLPGVPVQVTVTVEERAEQSRNVIAELPGAGDGVVVVGAHYDTVPGVDGANDNASGTGALLALAGELAGQSFPFTLRFIAFGSEETGLHGSRHYVAQLTDGELAEIKAMVNFDSVGGGNSLRATGDRWLTGQVSETADREGIALTVRSGNRGSSSDHASFRDAWIPVIYFHGDDSSRIHTPQDTLEYVNPALLGDVATLTLDLLESLESLPEYGR